MFDPSLSSSICCQVGEELTEPAVLSFRWDCIFSQLYFSWSATLTTYLYKQQDNNQPIPNSSYILGYFKNNNDFLQNSSPRYKNRRKPVPLLGNTGQPHILFEKNGWVEELKQPKQKEPSFISLGEGSQWTLKNPLELLAPWMWAHPGKHCVSIQWLFSLIFHQKRQQQPNPEYSTSWSSDFHQEVAGCNLLQKENRLMCPIYQVRDLNIDQQIKGILPALQQGFR